MNRSIVRRSHLGLDRQTLRILSPGETSQVAGARPSSQFDAPFDPCQEKPSNTHPMCGTGK